ncbi:hypothetical protein EHQ12_05635 [Leptospira gomenensis]|uniref:Uncharacterized protein n=1 Tax=Leptospira gomenensis TaxID=2484974 RepID=A0A5F1YC44_9LEPT|nr:hypothetical protein [Leptospira gomenensis]TGK34521.1 hypothetical protein EHQ17_08840 [Leptospira gomenensis]TGK40169.1 hypothetical protein EHQ07_19060 [Leptospira gomenensis]TGK41906.1 hypothetical protein EHQ12_05635 [Leptospira gomenensis]TGK55678.1 hypothetical protein EHQ13_17285 [Leptospira gomenensis]
MNLSAENEVDFSFHMISEEGAGAVLRLTGILSRKSIDWKDWRLWRDKENQTQEIQIVIRSAEPEKILNLFRNIPEITGVHYVQSDPKPEAISRFPSGKTGEFVVSAS